MLKRSPRTSLALLLTALAALAIGVTACGHGSSSGPAGSPARAIPASAIVYVQADVDTSSPAWTAFENVSRRFPGWHQVVNDVHHELNARDHGVSFTKDVAPALGADAAIAVTGIDTSTGKPAWVGYVALRDDSKIESDLKAGKGTAAGTYNGYAQYREGNGSGQYAAVGNNALFVASDENTLHTAIDTRRGDDPSLAGDSTFQQAMAALPADSLLKGFADPGKISRLLSMGSFGSQLGISGSSSASPLTQMSKELAGIRSAGFALWAEPGGYRATVQVATVPGASSSIVQSLQQNPTLGTLAPAGSFLFLDGFGSDQGLGQTFSQPSTGAQLKEIQQLTGISVAHDILPLLTGEVGAYAAAGQAGGPPRIALLLKPKDTAAAQTALTDLMHHLTQLEHGNPQAKLLRWGQHDGVFAVGTDLSSVQGAVSPLPGSPAWNSLLSAAGAPGDVRISLYVQVPQLLALFPIEQNENLAHVGGILAWSTVSGNQVSGNLFFQVK